MSGVSRIVALLVLAGVLGTLLVLAVRGSAGSEPLAIEQTTGQVQRERDGQRVDGRVGMHLAVGDRVITGPDGEAVLGRGGYSTVRLGRQTTVSLLAVDEGMVELDLERGQVRARVRPDAGAIRLVQAHRALLATDADFDVVVEEDGQLSMRAERGAVTVAGFGAQAQLSQGERMVAFADGQVATWRADPELLLDVQWPGNTPQALVPLTGRADPGATVAVTEPDGVASVRAGPDGAFVVEVPLPEGRTSVVLEVTDAFGQARQAVGTITRDATRPTFDLQLDYEPRR